MRAYVRTAIVAVASVVGVIQRAAAQPSASLDVSLNSDYVWRGVTYTNRFVIQPDLSISAPVRGLTLTAGAWGNIEPRRYDGVNDLSSLGGLPGPLVTQSELWLELSSTIRDRVETSFGVHGYLYPHVGDLADYNTVELQAAVSVDAFIAPSVTVAYDVGPIRGTFVEAGLSRAITDERRGSLSVGFSAGFSAGQAEDPRGRDLAYFDRDGLTHFDASASATFTVGRIAVAPEAHVIFAHDAMARVTGPDVTRGTKLWFGATLGWSSR